MAAVLAVAGCDKERHGPAPQAAVAPDQLAGVRRASEASIRGSARNPDSVRFRGIQVWPQAIRNQFAVCGQASVFGPASATYVLFVAVVTRDDGAEDPDRRLLVEARVGSTVTEATRVYVDTLARCFEGGGPQPLRPERAVPVPPVPDDMRAVLAAQPVPAALPAPAASAPAARAPAVAAQAVATRQPAVASAASVYTIVMRHGGNIHRSPQGAIIRVEPRGKELRVFGEAPGGWLLIGETEASGWVHRSMVERR
ncbi:hypothetical protein CCS01_10335 [Rhodopila globiformis]|uniref:SH3b domain-containing protein n=2 Tax=Rhodopila globiformis TaxID=1071 RepID=A0A2S6NIW5_RHOGL|nr:hypothetical protein CCS01_10335 [Rhodopila globiformis]